MLGSGLLVILLSGEILGQQNMNLNCQFQDVLMKCRDSPDGGYTYYNYGPEWEPRTVRKVRDTSSQELCEPCCRDPDTTIDRCPETDHPDEKGVSWDRLKNTTKISGGGWMVCRLPGERPVYKR